MPASSAVADRSRVSGAVLPLLATTQFLMTVDSTVMNVSISALVADLDTTVTAIQAVITSYTLVMAASMITGGKLGDLLGRRRALRLGLVVYAAGSGLTALSPNVVVLFLGWSVLEGLGAALIMPTVTALVAGNFTGQQRARAYGLIAASAAVAVAAGPIIGGFVTANFSWRWVFAAEVVIAGGLLIGSARIPDVAVEERPKLDGVGALLSAAGLAMIVLGVLQSSSWGWVAPRIADGPDATPQLAGISLTAWLVLAGLVALWMLVEWLDYRKTQGRTPLFDPELLDSRQLRGGLSVLLTQYLVSSGLFFTVPLFLSIVLGLDAFETGIRMLPLSLALIVVAPAVPRFAPHASPRRVARFGLLLLVGAALLLAGLLGQNPADAGIVTVPFVLLGAGLGLLASQLGNVIVSSEPVERSGEVGGLQYTAQNLGASLGTALIGAVVIGTLATQLLRGVEESPAVSDPVEQAAGIQLEAGVEFVSDAQLEAALAQTPLAPEEQEAIIAANAEARIVALQYGMVAVALVALLGLFSTRRIPSRALESATVASAAPAPEP
ncbi:MAG TPA: MFS transporter [Jiangellaceae bacterium]|nr:MFS transporter [Jiangellaceae bacterium]